MRALRRRWRLLVTWFRELQHLRWQEHRRACGKPYTTGDAHSVRADLLLPETERDFLECVAILAETERREDR